MRNKRLVSTILFIIVFCSFARADVVTDWNAIAVQSVLTAGTARPGPSGAYDVAMVHLAIYDAVQAIEGDYQPYYVDIRNASGSPVAAAAKAARDVLVSRFPSQAATLDTTYTNYLLANGILLTDPGILVGQQAAAGIIALRACDGAFPNPAPPPFVGSTDIGQWRPTPPANSPMNPGPWLGDVTPFLMTRTFQFRSVPPPSLTSWHYARDFREVKAFGALNNSSRSPEQTDMALFWAGNFVVMLNGAVRQLALANVDNVSDSSRLFALTTSSAVDTTIAVWNDKAFYNFWRPLTAIHNADQDGNPFTMKDELWAPLIANPPYPDYGSGANGLTGATMQALEEFFGRRRRDFDITTTNIAPVNQDTREYRRFTEVMDEVVDARVFLGIHFRFADEVARLQGTRIAKYANENYFRPVRDRGHNGHHDDDH
jgi:hypothetical protein